MSKSPEGNPVPLPEEIITEATTAEGVLPAEREHKPRASSKKKSGKKETRQPEHQTVDYSDAELLQQLDVIGRKEAGSAINDAIEEAHNTAPGEAAIARELLVEQQVAEKITTHRRVPQKHRPKKYVSKKDLKQMTPDEFAEHVRSKNTEMMEYDAEQDAPTSVDAGDEVVVELPKRKRRVAKHSETTVPLVMDADVEELSTTTDAAEKEREAQQAKYNEALEVARARKKEIEEQYELEKISKEAIEAAGSFDELFEALDTGKGLFGIEKENEHRDYFDTALLKSIITSVRNRELGDPADGEQQGIEYVTRSEGLRDKVFELLQEERKMDTTVESEVVAEQVDESEPIAVSPKTPPLVPRKMTPPASVEATEVATSAEEVKGPFDAELSDLSVSELPEDTLSGKKLKFKEDGGKRKIKKKGVASMLTEANEMPLGIEAQIRIAEQELKDAQTEHAKIVAEVMDVRHRMATYNNAVLSWFSRITGSGERNKATYQKLITREKEVLAELQEMEERIKELKGEVV